MEKDKKKLNHEIKISSWKNNAVYVITSILHEDTETQRQDQLNSVQGPVKMKMQSPLLKNS